VVVHTDRAQAARHAVEQLGARLLLLDDGFQHRKLARDLDLVLVDGSAPLGNGRLLPAGPLREPVQALERASILIGVGIETEAAARLAEQFEKPFVPAVPRMTLPAVLERDLSCPVFVLTSIARPARFLRMLEAKGLNIKGELAFRDHHHFSDQDLLAVILAARHCGAKAVVCTAKDRVRLPSWPDDVPLHVAEFALDFQPGGILHEMLAEWVGKAMKVNEK
jgi:tetraacyldisaccharide 4'-kinase